MMIKPTSEAWFEPWEKHLVKKGLMIHYNTELIGINHHKNKIKSCVVRSKGSIHEVSVDEYIVAINPFAARRVFSRSEMTSLHDMHKHLTKRVSNQMSFRIGFKNKIRYPYKDVAFVFLDSEFNITLYPQDQYWQTPNMGALWSGTLLRMDRKGGLYGKTAMELNKNQLEEEIKHQLFRSKGLQKLIRDNKIDVDEDVVHFEIWKEWKMNEGKQEQNPPKWSNTIYNQRYRPHTKTEYRNLFIGGAHVRNTVDVWSMEGAVESGKMAADAICELYDVDGSVHIYRHMDPTIFGPLKHVDDALYSAGLPSGIDVAILTVLGSILRRII